MPALKGEVDASETSRRRGSIEVALVYANPSVSYAASSPSGTTEKRRKKW